MRDKARGCQLHLIFSPNGLADRTDCQQVFAASGHPLDALADQRALIISAFGSCRAVKMVEMAAIDASLNNFLEGRSSYGRLTSGDVCTSSGSPSQAYPHSRHKTCATFSTSSS